MRWRQWPLMRHYLRRFVYRHRPEMILHWHGGTAGLDDRAGITGRAVGVEDLKKAQITHIVIPQINDIHQYPGGEEILSHGIRVVRGIERKWNAGVVPNVDLGSIIDSYSYPSSPGSFIWELVSNIKAPCHGIAWNLEHPVGDMEKYPMSDRDKKQWEEWIKNTKINGPTIERFRAHQFALIFRMIYAAVLNEHPQADVAVAYSAYPEDGAIKRYGCDFEKLSTSRSIRGAALPPITHMMCNRPAPVLPKTWFNKSGRLKFLHTLSTHPSNPEGSQPSFYRSTLRNRLKGLQEGDGIGMVHAQMIPHWVHGDQVNCNIVGDVLESIWGPARSLVLEAIGSLIQPDAPWPRDSL